MKKNISSTNVGPNLSPTLLEKSSVGTINKIKRLVVKQGPGVENVDPNTSFWFRGTDIPGIQAVLGEEVKCKTIFDFPMYDEIIILVRTDNNNLPRPIFGICSFIDMACSNAISFSGLLNPSLNKSIPIKDIVKVYSVTHQMNLDESVTLFPKKGYNFWSKFFY